ncbi:hypothetical protein H920_12736 [Fukomys damarensis]|uniref:Uncharacterized protein n=1 Tax=Fukomys damarensis TaxID=885580 RepID=A0A091D5R8_FUKDA|nr:hypothetical protein H920_12736 [Fukomys damarensis]
MSHTLAPLNVSWTTGSSVASHSDLKPPGSLQVANPGALFSPLTSLRSGPRIPAYNQLLDRCSLQGSDSVLLKALRAQRTYILRGQQPFVFRQQNIPHSQEGAENVLDKRVRSEQVGKGAATPRVHNASLIICYLL